MLRLAPWFHPIAVRDGALIQSYTDNSENLPGNLLGMMTLSREWCSRAAILAHHVLLRRSESPDEAHATLVRIVYLRQRWAPLDVPAADMLTFHILLYRFGGEISYCDRQA